MQENKSLQTDLQIRKLPLLMLLSILIFGGG